MNLVRLPAIVSPAIDVHCNKVRRAVFAIGGCLGKKMT